MNLVALVIGLVALVVVVDTLGWVGMRRAVVGTGAWFAVLAACDLASAACDAFAMHGFLRASGPAVPWRRVYAAQLSGIAINRLTPANTLGEGVKIAILAPLSSTSRAVSTVVMFNLCTIFFGIAMVFCGVIATALMLDLPADVAWMMWVGVGVLLAFATTVVVLVRRGAGNSLVGAARGIRVISEARAVRWRAWFAEIDMRLRGFADTRASGLARGLVGVLGSRCFNWLGTIVVLYAADITLTGPLVVASLSVGILVTWMSNIIPFGLGLADGTNYMLYGLLGASPAEGLVFTMVNRLRTVVVASIGLALIGITSLRNRA